MLSGNAAHFEVCGVYKSMSNIFWYNILLLKLLRNQELILCPQGIQVLYCWLYLPLIVQMGQNN